MPVVGRTEQEARDLFAELNRNIDTRQAFTVLSERLGADMSAYPFDGPVPDLPQTEHLKSRAALFPKQFDLFVDLVVPLLQERGLFRADYSGVTLRDHLGLDRPAGR